MEVANKFIRTKKSAYLNVVKKHVVFTSGVIIMLVVLASAWLAYRVTEVRSDLLSSRHLIQVIREEFPSGDADTIADAGNRLSEYTTEARRHVNDPVWRVASNIPILGANLSAVRDIAISADDITKLALQPLLGHYDDFNMEDFSPSNGRINYEPLSHVAPSLQNASATLNLSYDRLSGINRTDLVSTISSPLSEMINDLEVVRDYATTASSVATLLPPMLGADGPRNYLILVQNSAESRATGGIPGALSLLNAEGGQISLDAQTSAVAIGAFYPALTVDEQQEALYTTRLGTQMQNVNLTPDFPTAAETAKRMWELRNTGQTVDGVLALDPVVLSHLLEAIGPVNLVDSEILGLIQGTSLPSALTSDNVVQTLLSDVYREIEDPQAQDAYFSSVAAQIFSAFTDGQGDGAQLLKTLARSTEENRLYLWSSLPAEQDIIASTPLHGSVAGPDAGGTAFGVYFNDGTGAKMDFHVTRSVKLIQSCPESGYGQYTVRVTATNNAPANAGTSLPAYVTGGGVFGVEPGHIRTNYVVYGPYQAFVETATVDGKAVPVSTGKHGQRPVGTVSLELGPGETSTIDMIFSGVVQDSEPSLRVTPTIQSPKDVVKPLQRDICG